MLWCYCCIFWLLFVVVRGLPWLDILLKILSNWTALINVAHITHIFVAAEPCTLVVFDHGWLPLLFSLLLFIFEKLKLVLELLDVLVSRGLSAPSVIVLLLWDVEVYWFQISELVSSLSLLIELPSYWLSLAETYARLSLLFGLINRWLVIVRLLVLLGGSWLVLILLLGILIPATALPSILLLIILTHLIYYS